MSSNFDHHFFTACNTALISKIEVTFSLIEKAIIHSKKNLKNIMQKVNAKLNIFNNLYKFFIQTKIIEKEKKLKR